jgi:hypothetical protein
LDFSFNQFSGYVKVNNTKNMHYWMVESMRDPENDPIAFWTNGVSDKKGQVLLEMNILFSPLMCLL